MGARVRILFVGDVFGGPGRRAIEARLPGLREELAVDFCIVNGENAADGRGITAKLAERILAAGADVIYARQLDRRASAASRPYLSGTEPGVIRPANTVARRAGSRPDDHAKRRGGDQSARADDALNPFESAFVAAERLVEEAARATPVIVVDFHAEATSEKVALAYITSPVARHRGASGRTRTFRPPTPASWRAAPRRSPTPA